MLIHQFLEKSSRQYPDKDALIFNNSRTTYSELNEKSDILANALSQQLKIKKRERVAICLPNCTESVISIFAVLKLGAIFELIHPSIKIEKLLFILNDSKASAIILETCPEEIYQRIYRNAPSIKGVLIRDAAQNTSPYNDRVFSFSSITHDITAEIPKIKISSNDIACLVYTSGSTGEPKGIIEPHVSIDFVTNSIMSYLQNRKEDIIINTLPLSFDYGLYQIFMAFKIGGTLILENSFTFPGRILKKIESERVTGFPVVPTMVSLLLQLNLSQYNLQCLRYISSTGDVLSTNHIKKLRALFPWVKIYSMYGLTECKRALYLPPEEIDKHPDSVGIPIPGTQAWIEDEHGNRLAHSMIGELVVKGSHVMKGYWGKDEESKKDFHVCQDDGISVLYTHDLFRMDENGFFYFVSRADDLIKTRGYRVAPKEIENAISSMPRIREVAVVGIPDPIIGKKIKAVIVPDTDKVDEREVIAHCKELLEDFMIPEIVEYRREIPKTQSGKLNRKGLI